jgi:hypothetical protein
MMDESRYKTCKKLASVLFISRVHLRETGFRWHGAFLTKLMRINLNPRIHFQLDFFFDVAESGSSTPLLTQSQADIKLVEFSRVTVYLTEAITTVFRFMPA